jgi:6-phosphogluconolactonase
VTATADIRRLATPQDLFQAAADELIKTATNAIAQRGRFTIALSGGNTPKSLYALIAANAANSLPWDKVFFFWGDERHAGPHDPDSNYRMVEENILSKIPVPAANVFRVPAENPDAAAVADAYDKTLRKFFDVEPGKFPRFDLVLLGLGPDGHTASLFPETAALNENSRLVVANWVEKLNTHRITLTLPVLNEAAEIDFLVSGTDKAAALHEVLEGNAPAEKYPSKLIQPAHGKLIWFIDRAAASELATVA